MAVTLDLSNLISADVLASEITNKWTTLDKLRIGWINEKKELRNYIFATDTKTTSNKKLPWANSTTTPKLTQIYDNLKANYSAAIFPNSKWLVWEGDNKESADKRKKKVVQAYIRNKIRQGKARKVFDKCLDDFILTGNTFATVEYANEYTELDGELIAKYIGPKVVRISPYDIVFDPTAASFEDSPKIVRSLVSLGTIKKMSKDDVELQEIYSKLTRNRREVGISKKTQKSEGFVADGFSNIEQYYSSGYVELLTFYGDIFDVETGELKESRKIIVADRAYVIYDKPIASWLGTAPIYHAGWRDRPDNLYAMGPLDNLVGMQYRIDHLENLKADVFDQIALPMLKVRGDVQDFEHEPGARIFMGEEGDVGYLAPDATALNADFQIQALENKMEEMAGAPRQAMGIRTPGEKTAFEVERLENSASRIFEHKANKFEEEFIEPLVNAMLESARRNMDSNDLTKIVDDETGVVLFKEIKKDDIVAVGRLIPIGARHFAERARRVQNINQMMMIKQGDPSVGVHMSGKEIARIIAEELGEDELFSENIGVKEQMETQKSSNDAEAEMLDELQVSAELGM